MANHIVQSRQNLLDIALQRCGSLEAAFDIAQLNGMGITDELTVGSTLGLPPVSDSKTVLRYESERIVPATAITGQEISALLNGGEGIEFWGIEYDFTVQ